ncbi:MAG: hypothetical protein HOO97_11775 [Sideroxydans sp.]|nr:hypothetical protein [Sideroxydans sp.]
MGTFICDSLEGRNNLGKIVRKHFGNGCKNALIIAPYFSETDEYLDFSKIENKINILCDADDASCNPYTLEKLLNQKNVEIRSRHDIHAKVYLLDRVAIVASANPTPNGLGIGKIEAGVLLNSEQSIKEVSEWFARLWNDGRSEDIKNYDERKWAELKAKWDLSPSYNTNKLPKLSDLIKAKKIPKDVVFLFWTEISEAPTKNVVKKQASDEILNLPKNLDNWDYWIEREFENGAIDSDTLEKVLHTYRDKTIINIKTQKREDIEFKKAYCAENFHSKSFDVPINLKWNKKYLLLSLYRTDVKKKLVVDQIAIDMINASLKDRSKERKWKKYFDSNDGLHGYCSVNTLYKLIE